MVISGAGVGDELGVGDGRKDGFGVGTGDGLGEGDGVGNGNGLIEGLGLGVGCVREDGRLTVCVSDRTDELLRMTDRLL